MNRTKEARNGPLKCGELALPARLGQRQTAYFQWDQTISCLFETGPYLQPVRGELNAVTRCCTGSSKGESFSHEEARYARCAKCGPSPPAGPVVRCSHSHRPTLRPGKAGSALSSAHSRKAP